MSEDKYFPKVFFFSAIVLGNIRQVCSMTLLDTSVVSYGTCNLIKVEMQN